MSYKLILRSKNSPFTGQFTDINLGSVLSHKDLDNNFINIKGNLVYTADTSGTTLTMYKVNGGTIPVDLSGLISAGDTFTTGGTLFGETIYFNTTDALSAYSINLSAFTSEVESPYKYNTAEATAIEPRLGTNNNTGALSTIAGGSNNIIIGTYSSVAGGAGNIITGNYSFIGGGQSNIITGSSTNGNVIVGGGFAGGKYGVNYGNTITINSYSSIGGGYGNIISGTNYGYANIIGGGSYNEISSGNNSWSTIGGGNNNTIVSGSSSSFIGGGKNNNIYTSTYSSIIGGTGNVINHNNTHIIGSNITSTSGDTTHVERLNIKTVDTNSTASEVLVRESDGMINTSPLSAITGGINGKYSINFTFTAATTSTITHNLGSTDIIVQVRDVSGQLIIPNTVDNYTNNTVDINVSSTETMRVIIIG